MKTASQKLYYFLPLFPAYLCATLFQPTVICNNDICWGPAPIRWTSLIIDTVFFYLFWLAIFCVVRMIMRKIIELTSRKTKISMVLLALAICSAIATVYQSVELFNQAEADNLSCGWPMRYLSSSFLQSPIEPPYPWTERCIGFLGSEWGYPFDMQWTFFISNIIFFYLLWLTIFYGSQKIISNIREGNKSIAKNINA